MSIPEDLYLQITKSIPILCVDLVFRRGHETLLIERSIPPCKGMWCLIGGRVLYGEQVLEAVKRQALQEAGLEIKVESYIGFYDRPDRDSAKHSISLTFLVTPKEGGELSSGPEADDIRWFDAETCPAELGFDHLEMLWDSGFPWK